MVELQIPVILTPKIVALEIITFPPPPLTQASKHGFSNDL
jgi:hypothetical protein